MQYFSNSHVLSIEHGHTNGILFRIIYYLHHHNTLTSYFLRLDKEKKCSNRRIYKKNDRKKNGDLFSANISYVNHKNILHISIEQKCLTQCTRQGSFSRGNIFVEIKMDSISYSATYLFWKQKKNNDKILDGIRLE